MSRIARGHSCMLPILLALWLAASPAVAQTPLLLRVVPAQEQVVAGQTVDVAVEAVDVQELYAFDVTLTFDPTAVEAVDADPNLPGIQLALGMLLDPGFAIVNDADNVAGTAHLAVTQLNPSTPKSGTGSLLVVKLRGKQAGASSGITIVNGQLARPDGSMIVTEPPAGGLLYVVSSRGDAPTTTPMPTQGAGTPMPTPLETIPALPPILTPPTGPATAVPTHTPVPGANQAPTAMAASTSVPPPASTVSGTNAPPPLTVPGAASTTPEATAVVVAQARPGQSGSAQVTPASRLANSALGVALVAWALAIAAGAALVVVEFRRRRSTGL